jgi:hypothetical protein
VRTTGLLALLACLLLGCAPQHDARQTHLAIPSPPVTRCTTGYPNHTDVRLVVADNGRSITVGLCTGIDVLLIGPPSSQWQSAETSDAAVLTVVPLPLPAPPPGGSHLIYLAAQTGTAMLTSMGPSSACTTETAACPTVRWAVRITVVSG